VRPPRPSRARRLSKRPPRWLVLESTGRPPAILVPAATRRTSGWPPARFPIAVAAGAARRWIRWPPVWTFVAIALTVALPWRLALAIGTRRTIEPRRTILVRGTGRR